MLLLLVLLLLLAAAAAEDRSVQSLEAVKENCVSVLGGQLLIQYEGGRYLKVKCPGGDVGRAALDDKALSTVRVRVSTRVPSVTIILCSPPQRGYAALLDQLDITLMSQGQLALQLPAGGNVTLNATHLAGLQLGHLTLRSTKPAPSASADLLLQQGELRRLEVRSVSLPADALEPVSHTLTSLTLVDVGSMVVPAPLLARLEALVVDEHVQLAGAAPVLRVLRQTLAPGAVSPAAAQLTNLSLSAWTTDGSPWTACDSLQSLTLSKLSITSLPERWLAACSALVSLEVTSARNLTWLPERLLEGSNALTTLRFQGCGLKKLPRTLFDPVPNLLELDLRFNGLKTLPGGIFTSRHQLRKLTLAMNDFDKDVYGVLKPLIKLKELDLSMNRRLGDACPGGLGLRSGDSFLKEMRDLSVLVLHHTKVSRICSDWRFMRRLRYLNLQYTNIVSLSYDDGQQERDSDVQDPVVDLLNTQVRDIVYTEKDLRKALRAPNATVTLLVPDTLTCDCDMYYTASAIRSHPYHVRLEAAASMPVYCNMTSRPKLDAAPLDDMLCAASCGALPTGCTCAGRQSGDNLWYMRLTCENLNLDRVPAVTRPPKLKHAARVEWDLRLAGNNISALESLPPDVRWLDLRNNSVRRVGEQAAAALPSLRALRLGPAPLPCTCSNDALLRAALALALSPLPPRCTDGRALRDASAALEQECFGAGGWRSPLLWSLGVALLAVSAAAAAVLAMVSRPTQRARLKLALRSWGWLPRDPEPEDAARLYDAFVSYAHEDEATAHRMAQQLEAHGLRLCLHTRDWAPGEYIEAQIAASVRNSRRTVALVSRHWVASSWARVELRNALHASLDAPRLVLVLLEEVDALKPDRELRRCLATCTYIYIRHPHFLENLLKAVPPLAPTARG